MDTLLHHTFMLDRQMGRTASVLIPQEEWLFGFYAQFGYEAVLSVSADEYHAAPEAEYCPLRAMVPEDLSGMDACQQALIYAGMKRNGRNSLICLPIAAAGLSAQGRKVSRKAMRLFGIQSKRGFGHRNFVPPGKPRSLLGH